LLDGGVLRLGGYLAPGPLEEQVDDCLGLFDVREKLFYKTRESISEGFVI
jgi:hypothetical protein